MLITLLLAILTVLSTLVGTWDKFAKDKKTKKRKAVVLGTIVVAIAVASEAVQLYQKHQKDNEAAQQEKELRDANALLNSNLTEMDEASGGAMVGNMAYVVDDDDPGIFELEYVPATQSFERKSAESRKIKDSRPCARRFKWEKTCNDTKPTVLTGKMVDDFEGAAAYDNHLYLVTSQANSKKGDEEPQRWLFLEVDLQGNVVNATNRLRDAILAAFKAGTREVKPYEARQVMEVMQVEGLAIDERGNAYFGLRAPLLGSNALVFRGSVTDIFKAGEGDTPKLDRFELELAKEGKVYGITSMEYDKDQILILGNSPERWGKLQPAVWAWKTKEGDELQHPTLYDGDSFIIPDAEGSRPAKPEVLLLAGDHIHFFFDAEGTGGQAGYTRKGTTLSRVN